MQDFLKFHTLIVFIGQALSHHAVCSSLQMDAYWQVSGTVWKEPEPAETTAYHNLFSVDPLWTFLSKSAIMEKTRHFFNKVTLYYIRIYKSESGPTQTHHIDLLTLRDLILHLYTSRICSCNNSTYSFFVV